MIALLLAVWCGWCGRVELVRKLLTRALTLDSFLTPCSGFAGQLSAAAALDAVVQEASAVLIDIRSIREKEASGVPDVPGAASGKVRTGAARCNHYVISVPCLLDPPMLHRIV